MIFIGITNKIDDIIDKINEIRKGDDNIGLYVTEKGFVFSKFEQGKKIETLYPKNKFCKYIIAGSIFGILSYDKLIENYENFIKKYETITNVMIHINYISPYILNFNFYHNNQKEEYQISL